MGKKKKKLKKRCCGKFLKDGKHCPNCPLLIRESSPETGPERKKAGKKKKKKKKKKEKKTGKEKKK